MRRFMLNRHEDETGISGTGEICESVEFSDGSVALRWISDLSSHVIYKRIEDVIAIHGHDGKTVLKWLDA